MNAAMTARRPAGRCAIQAGGGPRRRRRRLDAGLELERLERPHLVGTGQGHGIGEALEVRPLLGRHALPAGKRRLQQREAQ
jgi:hypothetical protein